jgi:predicted transglutaminase-like cysteine proteinase
MRTTLHIVFLFALALAGAGQAAAGMLGAPLNLRSAIERIRLDEPTLAPLAYTRFCQTYADECYPQNTDLNARPIRLSQMATAELTDVNDAVNATIAPERNERGLAHEAWLINPASGDCNDYAVTKRHALLARGWPSDALLLAEVAVSGGEHHLVLVVRTDRGDMVLDNLSDKIKAWTRTPYRFVRMQSPSGSMLWSKVAHGA